MLPWVEAYVGIPYLFGGSTREGCDCWGLARMILRERFGKELPEFAHDSVDRRALAALVDASLPLVNAVLIDAPEAGDIALLRLLGEPCHVGLCVGDGYMIHSLRAHDSALERFASPRWASRLEGFYRV
ncbi:MAG: C40 family peptidase [Spirochaetaceae bacterium]|nr:C40 family peptidase [Spirochaetaceae bacterium]